MENKILMGYKGTSILDTGYIYAPYIPMMIQMTEKDKENLRMLIKIVKTAMKRAKYKINSDFEISDNIWGDAVWVTTKTGRRFRHFGQVSVSLFNARINVFWTSAPVPGSKVPNEASVPLADPKCITKIAEAIICGLKNNEFRPISDGYPKRVHASHYGKFTI
jgi:hypothetical protein